MVIVKGLDTHTCELPDNEEEGESERCPCTVLGFTISLIVVATYNNDHNNDKNEVVEFPKFTLALRN